ncbi:MAG: tRNA uridine-5-carboxymethylaminomethyl(34) synthesis GTPase MnmE [Deltaproteobacteria bacterium]|nr:tRNA uridine-5-carboxymethylaminomethyl(34) synthesis GTPase MnmE [Deltaproteobacteria bacterium]
MKLGDVIIAPATPMGVGAISIFRISGNGLSGILKGILPIEETEPRRIRRFILRDDKGAILDEITFVRYTAPNSYTGEDMVEIFSHGGIANAKRILEFFASKGLRIAEPGEFTFRAFFNGKISLTRAESIDRICKSENVVELNSALEGLLGRSEEEFETIYSAFINLLGEVVAELEFSEDEVDITRFKWPIEELIERINCLIESYDKVSIFTEGFDIVIAGKTNVGKSSLFNRLIGEERSIVTDIEGTTRDVVDKKIYFGNIVARFVDTAGIRKTNDKIELLGQEKTHQEIVNASLILYMTDVERMFDEVDKEIIERYKDKVMLVVNKIDLKKSVTECKYKDVFYISAKYNMGIDELKSGIRGFILSRVDFNAKSMLFNKRQYELFVNIRNSLIKSLNIIENRGVLDLLFLELKDAKIQFERLLGKVIDDDIYSNIFSRFCVGK